MTDKERLDWLEKNMWSVNAPFHYGSLEGCLDLPWARAGSNDAEDLRSAIDHQMKLQSEGKL